MVTSPRNPAFGGCLTQDAKSRRIPAFLSKLAQAIEQKQAGNLSELESLTATISHLKQIVAVPQNIARSGGVLEPVSLPGLFEQSVAIDLASLDRHEIEVVKEFTTKKDGHGFGLHSGALAAKSLGGALDVHSDGEGRGATFTLRLPTHSENLQAA